MPSQCTHYMCGCTCGADHEDVEPGTWQPFSYLLLNGAVKHDSGQVTAWCPCTDLSYAKVVGGGQWGKAEHDPFQGARIVGWR